jgi:hypothetical protein
LLYATDHLLNWLVATPWNVSRAHHSSRYTIVTARREGFRKAKCGNGFQHERVEVGVASPPRDS